MDSQESYGKNLSRSLYISTRLDYLDYCIYHNHTEHQHIHNFIPFHHVNRQHYFSTCIVDDSTIDGSHDYYQTDYCQQHEHTTNRRTHHQQTRRSKGITRTYEVKVSRN